MSRSEIATQGLVLAAAVAVVVGASVLIPCIRTERFTPVLLEPANAAPSTGLVVSVSGDAAHSGLYTLAPSTSLADVLQMTDATREGTPPSITIILGSATDSRAPQRVDLNHADAWLLDALPGIGPDRAQAIVDFREQQGPFRGTEDLTMVPGIGDSTYESLKEFVTVTP